MFGGIAPSNLSSIRAIISDVDDSVVFINYQTTGKTVVNGQTLCTLEGLILIKNPNRYPLNEFDGEEVGRHVNPSYGQFTDTIIPGQTMYYAAFPYSKQGVYNRSTKNRAVVNENAKKNYSYIFGYDMDLNEDVPSARVSYITTDAIDNTDYTPATLNSLNDWDIPAGTKFMPRPCMLKYDGTVDYFLDPNDYSKKADGTPSDITSSNYAGNAMMQWPKIYTKRWEKNGVYHFRCSDAKLDDDYECWCNYDSNGDEIEHFYTAIYRSSKWDYSGGVTRYKSMSGCNYSSTVSGWSFSTEKSVSRQDKGWDVERLVDHLLIQDLLVMIGRNTNTQTVFGVGRSTSPTESLKTGTANTKGLFYGKANNDSTVTSLKIFGMEDYWGDYGRRIDDLVNGMEGKLYAKIPTIAGDKSLSGFGDGYTLIGTLTGGLSGYISKMTTHSWGRLPAETKGSSTTYEADNAYFKVDVGSCVPAVIGGGVGGGLSLDERGAFTCVFAVVNSASWLGSRLSCKPMASS